MEKETVYSLYDTEHSFETQFLAKSRWEAISLAESMLNSEKVPPIFTELYLISCAQNCIICTFERENIWNSWETRPR
jgi:hypothetical protein